MRPLTFLFRLFPVSPRGEEKARSLLHALTKLVPPRILTEVLSACRDRRQWGTAAAAWLGLSETELMQAVAREVGVPFVEVLPVDGLGAFAHERELLFSQLERAGACMYQMENDGVGLACVDPAELRRVTAADVSAYPLGISTWTEIRAALDAVESRVEDVRAQQENELASAERELALQALQLVFAEVKAHGVSTVDLLLMDDRPRYQFLTADGRRGVGNVHAAIGPHLRKVLSQQQAAQMAFTVGRSLGTLSVRFVGGGAVIRVTWSPVALEKAAEPIAALPAPPTDSSTEEAAEKVASSGVTASPPISTAPRPLVLVADDNLMFARILERYLDKHGFSSVIAKDGSEALAILEKTDCRPAVLVTDLHMPNMNGRELMAKVRAMETLANMPVVVLTSDEDSEAELQMLAIGADAFVTKSKDPRLLCAHVARLASSRPAAGKVAA